MERQFSVFSPVGEYVGKRRSVAPRLPDLNGKTVCEVWNGGFRSDAMLPMISELLRNRYPGVKIIPHTEFPEASPAGDIDQICESLKEALLPRGCDAVIIGNGG